MQEYVQTNLTKIRFQIKPLHYREWVVRFPPRVLPLVKIAQRGKFCILSNSMQCGKLFDTVNPKVRNNLLIEWIDWNF